MFCIVTEPAAAVADEDFFFDFFLLDELELEEEFPHAVSTRPADRARHRQRKRAVVRRIMSRTLTGDQELKQGLLRV
jgi:hypothetical protein